MNKIKQFLKRLKKELMKPMTDEEYDGAMVMAGAKKCPHCKEFIHRR